MTKKAPKCLTMVNGVPILERLTACLNQHGFKRLVVVTGHQENHIREFLGTWAGNMKIDYIFSPLYEVTNNIYSLWMARKIINEPFLLVESDLVFDGSLLNDMLFPDKIAVARMQPWMNGSTVTVNQFKQVEKFRNGAAGPLDEIEYKTVNIYSLSLSSWHRIKERLDQYISAGRVNNYYETVFAEMVADGSLSLQAAFFDGKPWCEIDTIADLVKAEKLFAADRDQTTTYYNHTPQASGIARPSFQKTKSREVDTDTISLSGLRLSSPLASLINRNPMHGSNFNGNKEKKKDMPAGNRYDSV